MLSTNITLDDVSGDDVVFNQVPTRQLGEVLRVDASRIVTEPRLLAIRSGVQGKGATISERRNITFSDTKKGTDGVSYTASVSQTIVVPRNGPHTQGDILDLLSMMSDLMNDGNNTGMANTANASAILRGEG